MELLNRETESMVRMAMRRESVTRVVLALEASGSDFLRHEGAILMPLVNMQTGVPSHYGAILSRLSPTVKPIAEREAFFPADLSTPFRQAQIVYCVIEFPDLASETRDSISKKVTAANRLINEFLRQEDVDAGNAQEKDFSIPAPPCD